MRGEGGNLNLSPSRSPPSPHTPHPPQARHAPCGQGESGSKISLPRPPIRAERRQHRFSPPPGKHTIVDSPTPLENTADTDTGAHGTDRRLIDESHLRPRTDFRNL